jgi:hypothetical protein
MARLYTVTGSLELGFEVRDNPKKTDWSSGGWGRENSFDGEGRYNDTGWRKKTDGTIEALIAILEDPIPEDVVWIPVNEIVMARKNKAPTPAENLQGVWYFLQMGQLA